VTIHRHKVISVLILSGSLRGVSHYGKQRRKRKKPLATSKFDPQTPQYQSSLPASFDLLTQCAAHAQ